MNSVSSRMLQNIDRLERGMFFKAAAEVSDAAMVSGAAQPGADPMAQPEPSASEALMMMSQDPQVDPATRTFMMEAADRIRQVDAPLPPPQAQQQVPAQQALPPGGAPPPEVPAAPDESAMAEAKAASLRESLEDFGDNVNSNSNGKIAQSKIIEDRILGMLRNPTHY